MPIYAMLGELDHDLLGGQNAVRVCRGPAALGRDFCAIAGISKALPLPLISEKREVRV
jgi:hypothetical protein